MVETSARLLRLLSLFQARRYWSGSELASRLEITPRTLRRDVDRLRSLGYPVSSTPGVAGGYQLGAGATLPPLLLDNDEAIAVAVGLRTAAGGSVSGIEEASLRALTKVEQVMPSRLRKRLGALTDTIVPLANAGPMVDVRTLSAVANACRDQQIVRFTYRGRGGAEGSRTVEPHRLIHTGFRWYLAAWDLERRDWRTFRVDRMETDVTPGERFSPRRPPAGGFASYVSRSVSYEVYPHRARVIVKAPMATVVKRIPPTIGVIEEIDSASCSLQTGAPSLEFLAVHLAAMPFDFEVQEPPELLECIHGIATRLERAMRASGL